MKMAVVCANGKAGKWIVKEAMARGLDVTAVVRGENRTEAKQAVVKDLYDLTAEDLKGFDVVVDAFGAWAPETLPQHSTSLKHLCDILSGTDVRLLVVGGAGSLYVNPEHTAQVMDGPDFPDVFKPLASNMGAAQARRREVDVPQPGRGLPGRRRAHRQVSARRRGAYAERARRERHQLRRLRHRHGGRSDLRKPHPSAHQRGPRLNRPRGMNLEGRIRE